METLSIIRNPAGTYSFVGRVPVGAAYQCESDEDAANVARVGPGMAKRIAEREGRTLRARTFNSPHDAKEFARRLGYRAVIA